jgi:hypothetical protein
MAQIADVWQKVPTSVIGYRSKKQKEDNENYIAISFIAFNFFRVFLHNSNRRRRMAWRRTELSIFDTKLEMKSLDT